MKQDSMLRQIFIDGVCHFDNIKRTQKEENLLDEIIKHDDEIRKKLAFSSELSDLYSKTNDIIECYHCELENTSYIEGLKLGFIMCLEILNT